MRLLRTPDERFRDLPDFPFQPRYVDIDGVRIHYIDEGQGELVLCLHGVLEWSYSYRKMIPVLAQRHRVIVMDFPGFGRSDKFADRKDHTYARHRAILSRFINLLALDRITLVAVDWGAVIGLGAATERPEQFDRLVIMNTLLPTGERPVGHMFMLWRQFVDLAPDVPVRMVMKMGVGHSYKISEREMAGYEAPFPDGSYKGALVELPLSLPVTVTGQGAGEIRATRDALSRWSKPALIMFSDEDFLFSKEYRFFRSLIPTAKDQPDTIIRGAGHFPAEERGEEIAGHILTFMEKTRASQDRSVPLSHL